MRIVSKYHILLDGPLRVGAGVAVGLLLLVPWQAASQAASQASPQASPQASSRIRMETDAGTIVFELYADAAPVTVNNFLAYVNEGVLDGGSFFRTVRDDNQPDNPVMIDVIQGGPDPSMEDRMLPPIPLERTNVTGLAHEDGTLSMARSGPDTATAQFFICIGPQPELDFGGRRNPDGQGFAAFGKVVEGMDVVRAIQARPADGQRILDPVHILRVRPIPD